MAERRRGPLIPRRPGITRRPRGVCRVGPRAWTSTGGAAHPVPPPASRTDRPPRSGV